MMTPDKSLPTKMPSKSDMYDGLCAEAGHDTSDNAMRETWAMASNPTPPAKTPTATTSIVKATRAMGT